MVTASYTSATAVIRAASGISSQVRYRGLPLYAVTSERHRTIGLLALAHDQQIRDLARCSLADLLGHRIALRGHLGAHVSATQAIDDGSAGYDAREVSEVCWFGSDELPDPIAFPNHAGEVLKAWRASRAERR